MECLTLTAWQLTASIELCCMWEDVGGSERSVRSQLLKLYVSWRASLAPEVIAAIDGRMKTAKTVKREPETLATQTMKRAKHEHVPAGYEDLTPKPIPMRTNNPPYWSRDQDPNIIQIDSEDDSDSDEHIRFPVMSFVDLLMKAAEKCKHIPQSPPDTQTTMRPTTNINVRSLHVRVSNPTTSLSKL